jgi:hypothetical protein
MAKNKKNIKKKRRKPAARKIKSTEPTKSLLPLALSAREQSKIKKKALSACKRSWQALKKSDSELREFYEVERPMYEEWYNASHEKSFNEINSLRKECDDYHRIFSDIMREVEAYEIDEVEAYQKVTATGYAFVSPPDDSNNRKYTKNEEPNFNFSEDDFEDDFEDDMCDCPVCRVRRAGQGNLGGEDDDVESMARALFEEGFAMFVDEEMDERVKEKMFRDFCEEFGFDYRKFSKGSNDQNTENPETLESIRKQCVILFRKIAKELHPDKQDSLSNGKLQNIKTEVIEDELWLRSVAAYDKLDYATLCNVWLTYTVFCRNNDSSGDFTVAMLKELQHDLKNQNAEKRKQVRRYRKSGAFGFSKLSEKDKKKIYKQQEAALEEQIHSLSFHSEMMKQELKLLEKKAKKSKKNSIKINTQGTQSQKVFNF